MGEKEDELRLSLSLGGGGGDGGGGGGDNERNPATQGFPFKLMPSSLGFMQQNQQLFPSLHLKPAFLAADSAFPSSAERNRSEPRSFLAGIDVNHPATASGGGDEEVLVSSPNSTVSSVSGKKSNEREDIDAERGSSSQEDNGGDAAANKKKLRLSKEQAAFLEETFKEHNTLNPKQKLALAKQLNLRPRQVEVWFQNRRARTKLKQTEVDCEYLKQCCDNLTEENRRLQREVNDLRALKQSPQFYANMSPPTTLTMCPQCERVAVSSSSSSSSASPMPTIPAAAARQQNVQPPASKQLMALNPWSVIFPNQPTDGHCTQS